MVCALPVRAQDLEELPIVTRTFAVEDVRIVQAPGQVIEQGTVVLHDGLITAVGRDVEIPYDARRIDGDSLVVYAGFIDGLSHAGVETPKRPEETCDDVERPGDPPPACAGIQPDRQASDLLDPDGDTIEALREIGFTTAHVVPEGGMLPGTGAIISLAGREPSDMILEAGVSLFAQFEGASGVYPATDMGVIAKLEELYRQAQQRRRLEAAYRENPVGLPRLAYDAIHAAFYPVLRGERPLFFYAEGALDLHRALSLQEALGFPLALGGLRQAFDALEALEATEDAALFLTLDLPEAPDDAAESPVDSLGSEPAKALTPEKPGGFFVSDLRTISYKDLDEEKENLEARQALVRRQYYRTAGLLHEAGLRFGFMTLDAKPEDIRKNLRTMIEHGLPEEAALAAPTTDAAALLGLSERLGTVEEGKIANLVVTTGPYFEEESEVRYVFVDGRPFEYEAEKDSSKGDVDPAGTWRYTVAAPQGEIEGRLTIEGEPGALTGTITSDMTGTIPIEDIRLEDDELTFSFETEKVGRVSATLTVTGDEFEGMLAISSLGEIPVTGERTSGPSGR